MALFPGCKIYPQWEGEYDAGPVDPVNFPPPCIGTGGDRTTPGKGTFNETFAFSNGRPIGYYSFPFSTTALPSPAPKTPPDPLALTVNDNPNDAVPVSTAYIYDRRGKNGNVLPSRCFTDGDHSPDQRIDDMPLDDQGNVFSTLPTGNYTVGKATTWSYMPIVQEIPLDAEDIQCQSIKSEATLLKGGSVPGPDGHYFAFAVIEPGAAVYRVGEDNTNSGGVGPQRWGWYNHYIVAYLDGGEIPTQVDTAMDGTKKLHMVTQRLFFPRSLILPTGAVFVPAPTGVTGMTGATGMSGATGTTGMMGPTGVSGTFGVGFDVLEAPRGDTTYSPVCAVFSYDLGVPTARDQLPTNAQDIIDNYDKTFKAASPPYVFCLQVQQ